MQNLVVSPLDHAATGTPAALNSSSAGSPASLVSSRFPPRRESKSLRIELRL
jgi:hypothetical protein